MNKHLLNVGYCLLVFFLLSVPQARAQTCSVNAGVPSTVCVSVDSFMLLGNATGALATTATWALVSGPNVPTISSPTSAITSVTGIIAGTYVFSYSATCSDAAVVADSVTVNVSALPIFTAGTDTAVCGLAVRLDATLPSGATGIWSQSSITGSGSFTFSPETSPNSTVNMVGYSNDCPKLRNFIWTVTQGACVSSDTVQVGFGAERTLSTTPDQVLCGTNYTSAFYYNGCGGTMSATQLAGPATASITYDFGAPSTTAYNRFTVSGMLAGVYTFAVSVTRCSGTLFRDTFNVTIGTTVTVTNPAVPAKYICPEQYDSVYFFEPTVSLLPGETMTWNLTPFSKSPTSLANPIADTIGNVLRLSNVPHPDTTTPTALYQYIYRYTVSNGTCFQNYIGLLYLYSPLPEKPFQPMLNLACGVTSTNIAVPVSGSSISYGFRGTRVVLKPSSAPTPIYPIGAVSTTLNVSGLQPGKYVFSFEYYRDGNAGCDVKTAVVEVNVSAAGGLANAGTDQILPCGVDSTTLAGNTPPAGQVGTWSLVSGPSTVVLTNPNSPSLLITTLLPGAYTFRWAINNGITCPATSDIMSVIVTPTLPTTDAGADRTVCYGYSIPLTGTAFGLGTTGRWRQIGGPIVTIADSTASSTSISGTVASTVYTFTYTLNNVCGTDTDTVEITTGASQGPSDAVITTADQCLTTASTTLTATAPTTGTGGWSQLSGPSTATIASPSSNTTSVTGLVGGEYKFIWEVSATGCDTLRDTVSVAYHTGTITADAGLDRYVCKDSIHLNATTPTIGAGTWSQIGGALTPFSDVNSPTASVTGLVPSGIYDYRWTVKLGTCPAVSDDVHIVISSPPSLAKAMNDTTICGLTIAIGGTITLPLNADTPSSGIGTWGIIDAPYYGTAFGSIANVGSPTTTIAAVGGKYTIFWQVTNGACPASRDTVNIEIVPKADAGAATYNLCERLSQELRGTEPGIGTVLWSQVSGPSTATITNPNNVFTTIIDMIPGIYKFRYEVTHPTTGCSSFDTVIINNGARIVANAGRDTVFCWEPDGSITLFLQADTPSAGTGIWARTVGTGSLSYSPSTISNPTNATVATEGLHQFRWTVTNGGCQTVDYKDVLVEKLTVPAINFSPLTACRDSFDVSVVSPYSNFNYAWNFPKGRLKDTSGIDLTGPIDNNFLISDTNSIYLTITNPATGCTAKDSTAIIVDCASLPLPLEFLSVQANVQNCAVHLQWSYSSSGASMLKNFVVERSVDGRNYEAVAVLKQNVQSYTDLPTSGTKWFYRIKAIGMSDEIAYTPTQVVNLGDCNAQQETVYPNPANDILHIVMPANTAHCGFALYNLLGQLVAKGDLKSGIDNVMNISSFVASTYVLQIINGNNTSTHKVQIVR